MKKDPMPSPKKKAPKAKPKRIRPKRAIAAPAEALPVTPPKALGPELGWRSGLAGLALCVVSIRYVFAWSAFAGLCLLGIGTLIAGIAFGRD
jgi:hypothetical protein